LAPLRKTHKKRYCTNRACITQVNACFILISFFIN
jgi:hypothetical protein